MNSTPNPMTQLKIGSRVITRKFEEDILTYFSPLMEECVNREGEITRINNDGYYIVHGYTWPPSAVEPVEPSFQPEYGEVIQCRSVESFDWLTKRFIATRKQGTHLCENLDYNGSVSEWQYIRPIRKGLEDEIIDYFVSRGFCFEYEKIKEDVLDIIKKHNGNTI